MLREHARNLETQIGERRERFQRTDFIRKRRQVRLRHLDDA